MTRGTAMDDLARSLEAAGNACAKAVVAKRWEEAAGHAQAASSAASRLLTRARLIVELQDRGDLDRG